MCLFYPYRIVRKDENLDRFARPAGLTYISIIKNNQNIMETTNISCHEFDELREQFLTLQKRLDRQVEINERQLRRAIGEGIGQMRRRDRLSIVVCFAAWIICCICVYYLQLSLPFQIFTDVAMGINFVCSIVLKLQAVNRHADLLSSADLVRTTRQLLRYKRVNRQYLFYVGIPFVIIFFCWYVYELIRKMTPIAGTTEIAWLIFFCAISGVIGGAIGLFFFYLPSIRQANEMLERIEELQNPTGEDVE